VATHDELVRRAVRWLRAKGCKVIAWKRNTNCVEQPDALGFRRSGWSLLVECKVTRSDFIRDIYKSSRMMGGVGYNRFYLTPAGLVEPHEVPAGWGLLEVRGRSVVTVKESGDFPGRNLSEELRHVIRQAWKPDGQPEDATDFVH
jgi:hypothetical protein